MVLFYEEGAYLAEDHLQTIDLLKIDVEGDELKVLQGAVSALASRRVRCVQFEYGGCWIDSRTLFLDMYDFLTSFCYIIGKIMPQGIEFYDRYDQGLETFQMANFLACSLQTELCCAVKTDCPCDIIGGHFFVFQKF